MSERPVTSLIMHDFRVPVPDGDDDDPEIVRAEHEALAASPEFQARLEHARQNRAAGKGIPAAGAEARTRRPTGPKAVGTTGNVRVRLPPQLHRELVQQARQQGVSVNTLIITYLAREAGYTAATAEERAP